MRTMKAIATTTAGLRGAHWKDDSLPDGVKVLPKSLKTDDGAAVTGFLFYRGGEQTVVCAMHPREMLVTQYLVPEVLKGGCAMWVMGSRTAGNDLRLEHEKAVLDLAAGQRFLRENGYRKSVLLGTSGGGPLAAFYIQQAQLPGSKRIATSPAGRRTGLEEANLPSPDGLMLVSSHLGQGPLLLNCIDPSVLDERDPLKTDESLSIFNPRNGFAPPPHSSHYDATFLERYRSAQRARVARIDDMARESVARRAEARKRLARGFSAGDAALAAHTPVLEVWRTDADPRCFDLAIEPSDRAYGSLWGANPLVSNFGAIGFARLCTPESWLSNWSANSSNATMEKCAPFLAIPTLMIEYTGDNSVFPSEAQRLFDLIGTPDKTRHRIAGNHQGGPISPGMPNGQERAGARIRDWLEEKNFA